MDQVQLVLPKYKLRPDQIFSVFIMAGLLLFYPSAMKVIPVAAEEPRIRVFQIETTRIPVKLPVLLEQVDWQPENLTASAAAIIDIESGAILFEKNPNSLLFPASTTKLMTALVARDIYPLEQIVTINQVPNVDGASIGFRNGEQVTIHDLLKATLIQSGNEAAILLAQNHPDGESEFINLMNQKAAELELKNTNYKNVMGFDNPGHYSSARDLALLSRYFMKDPILKEIVATKTTFIGDVRGWYRHQIWNTHRLLNPEAGFIGIKTGTTEGAGEVLITEVDRNGHRLLFVVLGSQDRYQETLKLLDWSEKSFAWVENISQIE